MIDQRSIQALIALMDDPDEGVFSHVRDKLMEVGPDAIPYLESSWEERDLGLLFQSRIEQIIHDIQFESVKHDLLKWYSSSEKSLLQGALIIARYQYPSLDEKKIEQFMDRIERDCWLEINENMTAFEKVKVLNKIFFGTYGFSGNAKNYNSPLNSYLNTVIESKKGNPLSLSILYSLVAQKLGMPIYGVNLPNHFVLAYMDENQTNPFVSNANEYGVLFYINCFSKGSIFHQDDIIQFLSSIQQRPQPFHFQPCSNSDIIRRMLTNLVAAFQQVGNSEKVDELLELRAILD